MERNEALDIIEAVRNKVSEADQIALDAEYVSRYIKVESNVGAVAVENTIPETTSTPEAPTITSESLLSTLDTALTTYSSFLDVINTSRGAVKGRRKPEQLKAVDQATIRAEVEALVSSPAILANLQAEADYFTDKPEANSPAVGFDILVIPESLTAGDELTFARHLGVQYIRDARYNDKRTPEVTGKGYRIAFAPRHYNVPSGNTTEQTRWMEIKNQATLATQLQTATDGEALVQINNLQTTGALNNPNTRFHTSYFRRFDQAPFGDFVSCVGVLGDGLLFLDLSIVDNDRSTRALVVPKA